ncbi:hypothetical protein [Serratia sp. Se-RSBMAAmG]|uniref:hypothetical protein n=1 Tax=Serratia sp. Se-RSBMAAmG TaxID=3043305 RepID=UPI0024AF82E6|nr:hypothetical protein [Serratia sp. Se-RSBMAAmG]MDI6975997.1 hypothetical protein [Serratia sp. Se-RSBMAAmG]
MRINKSFYLGTGEKESIHIIKGEITVSYITSFLEELSFTLADLKALHAIEPALLTIDFDRWEKIIANDKKGDVAVAALKGLNNFAKDDVYFDEAGNLHISFSKEKEGGKDKGMAVAMMMPFGLIEAEEKANNEDVSKILRGWSIEHDALVAQSFGVKVELNVATKVKIFGLICEHLNEHIDETERFVDKRLARYSPLLSIMHISDHKDDIKAILDEVYEPASGKYYDEHKVGELLRKVLGMRNVKCI